MEDKFEQFLRNTLSKEETQKLLHDIESDSILKKEFEEYRDAWELAKVIERRALKEKVSKMVHHQTTSRTTYKQHWVWYSAASVLVIIFSYWFFLQDVSGERIAKTYFTPYPDKYTSMGQNTGSLSQAMTAYNKGNYIEAEKLFNLLPVELQSDVDLYRGICLYQIGEKNKAKIIFKKLQQDITSASREPAFWYLSITHLALNEKDSAISILNTIKNDSSISFHKDDALEIIEQLK